MPISNIEQPRIRFEILKSLEDLTSWVLGECVMCIRINSCCVAAGHMLIIILGLLVGLLILLVSLLSCSIFGCSLCLVLVAFLDYTLMGGAAGGELLSDLRVSSFIFVISMLTAWSSMKIVLSRLKAVRGYRRSESLKAH